MAKAIITIEDTDGDAVHITLDFDPPIDNQNPGNVTKAQNLAAGILETLAERFGGDFT